MLSLQYKVLPMKAAFRVVKVWGCGLLCFPTAYYNLVVAAQDKGCMLRQCDHFKIIEGFLLT